MRISTHIDERTLDQRFARESADALRARTPKQAHAQGEEGQAREEPEGPEQPPA